MSSVPPTGPEGNRAIEPRALFPYGLGPDHDGTVQCRVRGTGHGVPSTERYGPSGPPRALLPGVHHPLPYYYYCSLLLFSV